MDRQREVIGVVGLGYVGLPVALAFADKFRTVGYDVDERRLSDLRSGLDRTGEVTKAQLKSTELTISGDAADLADATFYVIVVPTPIDNKRHPNLEPLRAATRTVAGHLREGDVVVYESTVYPGVTEEECVPLLEQGSGLSLGRDFSVGYAPERINPGDPEHTFDKITKVVAGSDAATTDRLADVYGEVVPAGIFRATSIRVAEAAKVLENTQRDLNIALMNELAYICERVDIRTADVLEAAATKWNFLPFSPGLVGGHCIGVDPYYLTAKAQEVGYEPQVILSGRMINDSAGPFVARKTLRLLSAEMPPVKARVGILGLAFKPNVRDLRNSKVPDIVIELKAYGVVPLVCDPLGDADEASRQHGIALSTFDALRDLDALIVAVPHDEFLAMPLPRLLFSLKSGGVVVDVKSVLDPKKVSALGYRYWSL